MSLSVAVFKAATLYFLDGGLWIVIRVCRNKSWGFTLCTELFGLKNPISFNMAVGFSDVIFDFSSFLL